MTKPATVAADRLKSFIERIEKLDEEQRAIGGDKRDVYAEADGVGYDKKVLRKIVQRRRLDAAERAEQDDLQHVYEHALGMAVDLVRDGASLREAERQTGISKSVIHRAISVPAVSRAKTIEPSPEAWAFVTAARDAIEAERLAQREAARERRRLEREALAARNAAIDADPLTLPPLLAEKRREIDARRGVT